MFKRHWIRLCEQLPSNRVRVRAWDLAGSLTGFDPDWTVGLLMSRDPDGFIFIEDVQRFRATPGEVERQIKATAALDGKKTTVVLPQDPGSAGKAQVSYLTRALQGYRVKCNRVSGDKETRAGPFASQCEHGNVMMLRAPWNEEVLGELCTFPNGRHDDIVDAASDAFNELAEARCGAGSLPMVW
jgi:predicted phage terminase large subunit-like protein